MIDDRFSTVFPELLTSPDMARAPFAPALSEALTGSGEPSQLIYTPSYEMYRTVTPASVLAITNNSWILLAETPSGKLETIVADFSRTLWVELTSILLYGNLRITYLQDKTVRHASIVFNTVRIDYYQEATERILRGMRGLTGLSESNVEETTENAMALSLKFRAALHDLTPPGEHVQSLLHWPTITSHPHAGIQREEAPATMLALTEGTLFIVREDLTKESFLGQNPAHYGKITTFLPLHRLHGYSLRNMEDRARIELAFHAATGTDIEVALPIEIPLKRDTDVQDFLAKLALAAKAADVEHWHAVVFSIDTE